MRSNMISYDLSVKIWNHLLQLSVHVTKPRLKHDLANKFEIKCQLSQMGKLSPNQ